MGGAGQASSGCRVRVRGGAGAGPHGGGGARVHGLGGVLYVFGGWVSGAMGGHEHDLPAGLWVCCMPPSRLPRVLCHGCALIVFACFCRVLCEGTPWSNG